MAAETPIDPSLVADQCLERIASVRNELLNTLTTHFKASFAKQEALLQEQMKSLEELEKQLQQAHQQITKATEQLNAETDTIMSHFIASGESACQKPAHNPHPTLNRLRAQAQSSRMRTRLSDSNPVTN